MITKLIAWTREALNRGDHVAADRLLKQINELLNGRANQ